jgi:putative membrane protein
MSDTNTTSKKNNEQLIVRIIIALSIIIPLAVAVLFALPDSMKLDLGGLQTQKLPFFHAILNGSTAILLLLGYVLIRRKQVNLHRIAMVTAFVLSAVFLISYVVTHISTPDAKFGGEGWIRPVYFTILISHIVLSIPVLPLAMFAIYRGWTGNYEKHKKVVRYTFPIWLYVAITGVLVYIFMSPYYPS